MVSTANTEINYAIQHLQTAVSIITQVTDAIERETGGVDATRCAKYLRSLAEHYNGAIHDMKTMM